MKNLLKTTLAVIAMLTFSANADAQQDPMFTQYFFNPLSINSGYAGTREAMNVTLLAREQWVGIEGRPRTQSLVMHTPLPNESLAVGLSFRRDEAGPTKNTSIFGDFAYRMRVTEKSRLALGLKAGVSLFTADLTSLTGTDGEDISFSQNLRNKPLPNFGFSAYWWSDRSFLGISTPKLIENEVDGADDLMQGREVRHYFLMAGTVIDLNSTLKLKPTTLIRYVNGAPISFDVTANLLIDERLWIGGMYRYQESAAVLCSFSLTDQLRAGYSYDFPLTDLASYSTGSHELMLSYDFTFKKDKTLSPRYF
ncbi:PorP/SprF family type IX secretion system membrane protein [Sanyastnella coralliicola]|uniref:PorP/SprF family type IX secretion system membrane protein n=1 Tax=Sanyastnella coralliicola TaxID=3069118 RepID=UPI0027B98CB5|nr:type IX secretion system membrane protein PorP/SprF [Longitalea sp. SCSIO 12813]